MKLANATVLITGANRGLGLAFAKAALARGARKVYAGARDPASITLPGVTPIKLDVTSADDVATAAAAAGDVTLVINNAGIAEPASFMTTEAEASLRRQLDVNVFGTLRVSQAFAPVLARNGGGALLNATHLPMPRAFGLDSCLLRDDQILCPAQTRGTVFREQVVGLAQDQLVR